MKFRIDRKAIRVVNVKKQPPDFAYWQTRTVSERLEALESLRQQFFGYTDETAPRLQRVFKIVKRKRRKRDLGDLDNLK